MIKKELKKRNRYMLSSLLMSAALLTSSISPVYGAEDLLGNNVEFSSELVGGDLFYSEQKVITAFEKISDEDKNITVYGSGRPDLNLLYNYLPETLDVRLSTNDTTAVSVKWICEEKFSSAGFEYHFHPQIKDADYQMSEQVSLPRFTIVLDLEGPVQSLFASANETAIYNFLKTKMGLNAAAACGVLANIRHESSFDPHALGDYGTSYGICQWHNERWDRLKDYCKANKLDSTTLNGQLYYLNYELSKSYPSVLNKLKSVPNTAQGAYDAAYYWCYYFEVPADTANTAATRGNSAKTDFWPVYGTGTTTTTTTPTTTTKSISSAAVTLSASNYVYDGTAKMPSVTVKYGSTTLVNNRDYTLSYSKNISVGTAYVTITGKGSYTGSVKKAFKIGLNSPKLKKLAAAASGIKVSWNAVTGASSYAVYRKTAGGSWKKITTTSSLSYVDTNVSSGTAYTYTVRGVYGGNEGFYNSKGVSAKFLSTVKVSGLSNTAQGISFKWNKVSGASGYAIYRKKSGGKYILLTKVNANTSKYVDSSVAGANNTIYSYAVRAYNGSSMGYYKAKAFIRLTAPTLYSARRAAKNTLGIGWYQNAAASGYQICYMNTKTKKKITSLINGGGNTSCQIKNIPTGTYKVCVRAYKTISGKKYPSAWSSVKTVVIS